MMTALLSKLSIPLLILTAGIVGGIGLQQKVLSRKEVVKVDYDKVREIVAEELAKLPKPKPLQGVEIDKLKGKGAQLHIHQNYDVQVNGDSLTMDRFAAAVEERLKKLKVSRCK